jgi:hypothetical protein
VNLLRHCHYRPTLHSPSHHPRTPPTSRPPPQALKAANIPKNLKGKGDMPMNPRHMQQTMQRMAGALPPQLLKQMGGASGLTQLMKSMEQMQGGGMPGGGGGGGKKK